MPLTTVGDEVMVKMKEKYGDKAESVFYGSINKGNPGTDKWHGKKKRASSKFKRYHEQMMAGPGE